VCGFHQVEQLCQTLNQSSVNSIETVQNLPKSTTHFSVFDALKAYHQIELDDESQNLTAFMTSFGRYIYLRLAFGLLRASEPQVNKQVGRCDWWLKSHPMWASQNLREMNKLEAGGDTDTKGE
jgi:hypothetical protein